MLPQVVGDGCERVLDRSPDIGPAVPVPIDRIGMKAGFEKSRVSHVYCCSYKHSCPSRSGAMCLLGGHGTPGRHELGLAERPGPAADEAVDAYVPLLQDLQR